MPKWQRDRTGTGPAGVLLTELVEPGGKNGPDGGTLVQELGSWCTVEGGLGACQLEEKLCGCRERLSGGCVGVRSRLLGFETVHGSRRMLRF